MSKPSPYHLTVGEDGLSVRCELDVHYLTDEQLEAVRTYVETLQAENAKLRELVRDMFYAVHPLDREKFLTNVVELGVGVDA